MAHARRSFDNWNRNRRGMSRGGSRGHPNSSRNNNNLRTDTHASDHDHVHTKSKKIIILTPEKRVELLAASKCFKCEELGHLCQDCPTDNIVKFSSSKPPGVPSYSMEMDLLEEGTGDVELLSSMPVGMISYVAAEGNSTMNDHNHWRLNYPIWQWSGIAAQRYIGDCYAMTAKYQLTTQQPYPGDEFWSNYNVKPDDCFRVVRLRKNPDLFNITDKLATFEIPISINYLSNPKFNLSQWYTKWRAQILGLDESV